MVKLLLFGARRKWNVQLELSKILQINRNQKHNPQQPHVSIWESKYAVVPNKNMLSRWFQFFEFLYGSFL